MAYHFEELKKISYKIFKVKHTSLNGNELTLKNMDESKNKIIAKIYELNINNSSNGSNQGMNTQVNLHNNNHNENKILEEPKLVLDENKKIHLEFLFKLMIIILKHQQKKDILLIIN